MTSKARFSGKEYNAPNKATSWGVYLPTINAGNIAAVVAGVSGIQTAANAISLGTFDGLTINLSEVAPSAIPTDQYAQREAKWKVYYTDNVDSLGDGSFEMGMPDLTYLAAGAGNADLTDVDVAAFVTALEGTAVSRLGNAITVTKIVHVGRNL